MSVQLYCSNCKVTDPETVEDYAAGDLICKECGLILGDRIVDEHSEWRTFSNSDTPGSDPNRVGGPANPLLSDGGLSTIIGKSKDGTNPSISKWQTSASLSSSDRSLLNAFQEIGRMAERMSLPQTIRDRANEIYKQVDATKSMRGRTLEGITSAALFIACRVESVPRSFKEICAVTNVSKKELGKCFKFMSMIPSLLESEDHKNMRNPADYMDRYCSNLHLPMDVKKAAAHVAEGAMKSQLAGGKSYISVAAAAIYMVSQLSSHKKTQKAIGDVVGVSEVTIRNAYKDLYPSRYDLLPAGSDFLQNVASLPTS